jgi:hypothetical protein
MLAHAQVPQRPMAAQSNGVITGSASGPNGPLGGLMVQALDAAGAVAGEARVSPSGTFTIDGLPVGTFLVQVVTPSGAVICTGMVTIAADEPAARIALVASAAALAALAAAATTGVGGGVSTTLVLASLGAAASTLGAAAVIANDDEASPSR